MVRAPPQIFLTYKLHNLYDVYEFRFLLGLLKPRLKYLSTSHNMSVDWGFRLLELAEPFDLI